MLQLREITKTYGVGATAVEALKGVSLNFRKSEFVSILGPSGCGKTTLLNIVGGLDRYTTGDLIINGVSTTAYKDRDWDGYRNHSVGFVFQSYNLIGHQSIIKNVELALTLSGVNAVERHARAKQALELVGLKDQIHKKPNQLSGGQMQRVAIARAIVNDPDIILADEPTGALDSETSVQIMEILKELSKDRLVIMVTHNGELAEQYSTRIISVQDGLVVGDTMPYSTEDETTEERAKLNAENSSVQNANADTNTSSDAIKKAKKKKPSMSFFTALGLSLNNLYSKKFRTILTSLAGSFGIIGIALILSLSAGFNAYINNVQRDTLSNYPLTITAETTDYSELLKNYIGNNDDDKESYPTKNEITSENTIENMLTSVVTSISTNDLTSFKEHLDKSIEEGTIDESVLTAIKYTYNLRTTFYSSEKQEDGNYRQLYPVVLPEFTSLGVDDFGGLISAYYTSFGAIMNSQSVFSEMINNDKLIETQYELLHGDYAKNAEDVILVVDSKNQISDVELYMLGLMNDNDIKFMFHKLKHRLTPGNENLTEEQLDQITFEELGFTRSKMTYKFEDFVGMEFNLMLNSEQFTKENCPSIKVNGEDFQLWSKRSTAQTTNYIASGNAYKVRISGIVRQREDVTSGSLGTCLCYTEKLTRALIQKTNEQEIVIQQKSQEADNETGLYTSLLTLKQNNPVIDKTEYDAFTKTLAIVDEDTPASISIYPMSFETKDDIVDFIEEYNASQEDDKKIKYTDYIGLMMSSITTIINAITYVLIAFVSISLVVSSVMIAIITHVSVLERTKEIGILRAIGASKNDISHVFNAETFIIGATSGIIGILVTLLLNIPVNMIITALAGLHNVAKLPVAGGFALILVSIVLTLIAGFIPAKKASKQDPVVALRSE